MRKAVSLVLLAIFVSSAIVPVSAQKSRNARPENNRPAKNDTSFAAVEAVSGGAGVFVEWTMEAETDNLGFFVYRKSKGGLELLNGRKLVTGTALRIGEGTFFGEWYSFYDPTGTPGETYYVESASTNGKRTMSRAVTAEFSMGLKTASVASFSAEAASAVQAANSLIEYRRLSPPRELGAAIKAGAHRPNVTNHGAVLAQPGVRIGVKKEGIYRVSRQQLEDGGFSGGADPSLWQLFLEGVEQAIIVGPSGDYIEFYGKGVDTQETDTQMYYLIVGNTLGKRIAEQAVPPNDSTSISSGYLQSHFLKERTLFNETIVNGAAENYFGSTLPPNVKISLPVTLTGVDPNGPNAVIDIKLQGLNVTNHIVEVSVNGIAIAPIKNSFIRPFSATYSLPAATLVEGVNNFQFRSTGANDFNAFDSLTVWYQRRYMAENNAFSFFTKGQEAARLEGFTSSNIRVFDITTVDEPVAVSGLSPYTDGGSWSVDIPAGNAEVMYAVGDSGVLNNVTVSPIETTVLKTTANQGNLVIITHKDFLAEAETWANYRRGQGLHVVVAEVSDIYDEFDYGKQGPDAVENFLRYAVNNWQTPPQYVLLIGDATNDPRNYEGKLNNYRVPTRFVDTTFSTVPSDESMADFNDDGLSEVAIGRVPAQTAADVTVMFNKTVNWEAPHSNGFNRGALFAYDNLDQTGGMDFGALSAEFSNELPEDMPKTFLAKGEPNSTTILINQMNTGNYLVNYEGHGLVSAWANTFFSAGNVPSLTNLGQESIYLMLTCYNGAFARVGQQTSEGYNYFDSLGEALIRHPNGGAVAAWSSPGKTTMDVHKVMGKRFFQQLSAGNISRMGDLVRDAKASLNAGPEVRLSWVLLGDPMLRTQ